MRRAILAERERLFSITSTCSALSKLISANKRRRPLIYARVGEHVDHVEFSADAKITHALHVILYI